MDLCQFSRLVKLFYYSVYCYFVIIIFSCYRYGE